MASTPVPERREAICEAVYELLGEVGYDNMSMDAVAARARASKATIYRAWPSKPELVMAAVVNCLGRTVEPPDTGSLRGDLLAQLTMACDAAKGDDGAVIVGLLSAAARNAELAETMHKQLYESKCALYESILANARARGEVGEGADPDLLHELLSALILSRRLGRTGPMDDEFITRMVDRVLLPVLRQDT
jgi:AcrR family transcriptional regulator